MRKIPDELKAYKQWVCVNGNYYKDKDFKAPINPTTLKLASNQNPNDWGTYDEAIARASKWNYPHIGFVLTNNDPYCVIDLDDKVDNPATPEQIERFGHIIREFDSYTELSQSGRGVHVFVKGSIPEGRNQDGVEIYSSGRYIIVTGNQLSQNSNIEERSNLINGMYSQMSINRPVATLTELDAIESDEVIMRKASLAKNGSGDKFKHLWTIQPEVGTRSDYMFALVSLLAFYSQSNAQVKRLFRQSNLGQIDKYASDYHLDLALSKIRPTLQKPQVDLSQLSFAKNQISIIKNEVIQNEVRQVSDLDWPDHLIGRIAKYIYSSSLKPVREISITSALAIVTAIAARAYNISNTGLNQYFIVIAGTGRGKEEARKGIDRIINKLKIRTAILGNDEVALIDEFMGAGAFASGQGMVKLLAKKPCFLSILGEFGKTLGEMTGPRSNPNLQTILKCLLDVFNKSGHGDYLRGTVYSDDAKDTPDIRSPNITILGEGATASFYDSITEKHILDGLVPRFTIVEYDGPRVSTNQNAHFDPDDALIDEIMLLFQIAYSANKNETCYHIQQDSEGERLLKGFDAECDSLINNGSNPIVEELWNRAHLKVLKMAGSLAVGKDPYKPIVDREIAQYAIDFIKRSTYSVLDKFNNGEVGEGDHRQENDFRKCVEVYINMTPEKRNRSWGVSKRLAETGEVIPFSYLKKYLRMRVSFKDDRKGAYSAIEILLGRLVKEGALQEFPPSQAKEQFGTTTVIYTKGYNW